MTNINWGQFSNNFSNNFNQVGTNGVQQNQPVVPQPQVQQQSVPQQTLMQTFFPNATQQLNQTFMQLASLNQQQTMNMLKELLQFPKNFEQLLSQLTTNTNSVNTQTALLLLMSNLDFSKLSSLLQNSSKEAMSNLYQMLAQYNQIGMSIKDEQLGELTKLISFVAASSSSDVQSLKATMLMYLPWLPLTDPDAFKLNIAEKNFDGGLSSDDSISILMSTQNYGNIKVEIFKTDKDGIRIDFVSSETFPIKAFDNLMKEESKKYSININLEYTQKSVFNKDKKEVSKTQITMNTSPGVNPFLLVISNAVIKNIHSVDEMENLREVRKEKLE